MLGARIWRNGGKSSKKLKELEDENRKLKRMFADVSLDLQMAKDVLAKKW